MFIVTLTDTYFAKYIIENKARCDNKIMITKKKTKKKQRSADHALKKITLFFIEMQLNFKRSYNKPLVSKS